MRHQRFLSSFARLANPTSSASPPLKSPSSITSRPFSSKLRLVAGGNLIPDTGKGETTSKLGEDAYFISPGRAFGVADGVGWWSLKKIDSGMYSRSLMKAAADYFALDETRTDPLQAMLEAEKHSKLFTGTCTFCTIALKPENGEISALVLGDSGFMVIRKEMADLKISSRNPPCDDAKDGECLAKRICQSDEGRWKIVYKSQEQQVRFNMPYAVGTNSKHTSLSAITVNIPIRRGDIIIAATDGLFDNLFINDILQIVTRAFKDQRFGGCFQLSFDDQAKQADKLARLLTESAVEAAMNATKRGPFAQQSLKAGYLFEGGKMDDITAVVALVTCDVS